MLMLLFLRTSHSCLHNGNLQKAKKETLILRAKMGFGLYFDYAKCNLFLVICSYLCMKLLHV